MFSSYLKITFFIVVISSLFVRCQNRPAENQIFELLPSHHTGITFSNDIFTNDTLNALNFDYIYNGGGVAVGDINGDGLPDLFFSGNMVSSRLYLNKGDLQFEDITDKAGLTTDAWVTGVSFVDINGNGLLDIYLCVASKDPAKSKNKLYINNGDLTFTEMATAYGLDDDGYSTHAAFFDFDRDGDLDVYILTNAYETTNRNSIRPKKTKGESKSTDRLYRNNGDGTFSDISMEAGISIEGYGLGVAIADINRDGWPDIYVSNDFITNDLLWINNADGTFTEKASDYLKHQSFNGMGVDIADFNNDGLVDIAVMDMLPPDNLRQKTMFPDINYNQFKTILSLGYSPQYVRNTLQLNNGNNTFSEIGLLAGVHETDWSWAPLFADFNNNGHKDLFITNGYRKDVTNLDFIVYNRERSMFGTQKANLDAAMDKLDQLQGAHLPNFMFKNNGGLVFEDVSLDWGIGTPAYSNGAAFVDLDNDGDLDLVINNIDLEASVYKNNSQKFPNTNFIQIQLVGEKPNMAALGSKITVYTGERMQYYEHHIYRGYKSTVTDIVHFGLGEIEEIDSVEIIWPDERHQKLSFVPVNQKIILHQHDASKEAIQKPEKNIASPLFTEISGQRGLDFVHQNINEVDFYDQFLIPHTYSQNGPGIAVGDINGDGLDDFFIGGASGFPGKLFTQEKGHFRPTDLPFHSESDDMGALFFDSNGNGNLDLYVVSGGSSHETGHDHYADRLYINDGNGNFSWDEQALPKITDSGSKVIAADFDGDGLLDLFVGGRVVPSGYPLAPKSYILKNHSGKLVDVTRELLPELHDLGMVTDAIWTDFDNDGLMDLIVVGEWIAITFFKNMGDSFSNVTHTTGLQHTTGWWNSITAGDFNGDGNTDYILGNLGLNSRYKASKDQPVSIYAADFDNNNSIDPIMTRFIQGKEYPVHPRDNLISQIPSMKRRLPRYHLYGESDIEKVLTKEERKKAYKLNATYMESAFLENLGNGKFNLKALPVEGQIAPVFGIIVNDFDGDGNLDVLLSGNSYASEVHSGWYDAGIGLLLQGDGSGNFQSVHHEKSGFFVDKNAKGMAEILLENESLILIASNNDTLKTFTYSPPKMGETIRMEPLDTKVTFFRNEKIIEVRELYHGSSYLSQSSRTLRIPEGVSKIRVENSRKETREIPLRDIRLTQKE